LDKGCFESLLVYGLYAATVKEYKRIILKVPDTVDVLMVVGHNPVLSDLAQNISPKINNNLPPAGVLVFQWADGSWEGFLKVNKNPVEILEFN
jgi:phosphohistidine phosphatase